MLLKSLRLIPPNHPDVRQLLTSRSVSSSFRKKKTWSGWRILLTCTTLLAITSFTERREVISRVKARTDCSSSTLSPPLSRVQALWRWSRAWSSMHHRPLCAILSADALDSMCIDVNVKERKPALHGNIRARRFNSPDFSSILA